MSFEFHIHKDIDKALQEVKDEYTWMEEQVNHMREKLDSWNKDEEIQKYKNERDYVYKHSFLQLSDKEMKSEKAFREEHYKNCALPLKSKAAGNTYIYEITGTGLGTIKKIKCPICGVEKDFTDIDSW